MHKKQGSSTPKLPKDPSRDYMSGSIIRDNIPTMHDRMLARSQVMRFACKRQIARDDIISWLSALDLLDLRVYNGIDESDAVLFVDRDKRYATWSARARRAAPTELPIIPLVDIKHDGLCFPGDRVHYYACICICHEYDPPLLDDDTHTTTIPVNLIDFHYHMND